MVRARFTSPLNLVGLSPQDRESNFNNITVNLLGFMDEEYMNLSEDMSCSEKASRARIKKEISIPITSEYSEYLNASISQVVRTRMWYFFIEACEEDH